METGYAMAVHQLEVSGNEAGVIVTVAVIVAWHSSG